MSRCTLRLLLMMVFVIVSPSALLIAINAVMEIFSRIASHGPSREKRKGEKVCKTAEQILLQ